MATTTIVDPRSSRATTEHGHEEGQIHSNLSDQVDGDEEKNTDHAATSPRPLLNIQTPSTSSSAVDSDNAPVSNESQTPSRSKIVTQPHKLVETPRYVRSNPIGLQRANTFSSSPSLNKYHRNQDHGATPSPISPPSPASPGRRAEAPVPVESLGGSGSSRLVGRRTSVTFPEASSLSSSLSNKKPHNNTTTPARKHRSLLFEYGDTSQVSDLPSDPKTWTPSQLSIYLSHMLRLTPKPVIADVMKFIVQRGLTGKRFLRMRNQDLVEMGININWCRVLSTARERLRRECLRGRILGFASEITEPTESVTATTTTTDQPDAAEENIETLFLRLPNSGSTSSINQEWNKNSWRRTKGKDSRGRVKGIAKVFEKGEADEDRRHRIASSNLELDEIARIRRDRQTSTGSEVSTLSSKGEARLPASYSMPDFSPANSGRLSGEAAYSVDVSSNHAVHIQQASDSDSELENEQEGPATPPARVDWSSIAPISIEETALLPSEFLVADAELLQSPTTPRFGTFAIPSLGDTANSLTQVNVLEGTATKVEENYMQSIRSHGDDAYARVRAGQPILVEPLESSKSIGLIEGSLLSPQRRLSQWLESAELRKHDKSTSALSRSFPSSSRRMPTRSWTSDNLAISEVNEMEMEDALADPGMLHFAESDGKIITMKKSKSQPKRSQSVEDFGSIRFETVHSKISGKSSIRGDLRELFRDDFIDDDISVSRMKSQEQEDSVRKRMARRLSSFFSGDDEDEKFYSIKSRTGSVIIMPRAEVEQMQARLKELEEQLERAKAQSTTETNASDGFRDEDTPQAMSAWVKGALGEANTIVRGDCEDGSWRGLGSWALAAGLGIGLVIGEAVIHKLSRR